MDETRWEPEHTYPKFSGVFSSKPTQTNHRAAVLEEIHDGVIINIIR